jgi:hypothetical protein
VPLATALCKNLPTENTQRHLSRPKPTRVVGPTEEEEELKGNYFDDFPQPTQTPIRNELPRDINLQLCITKTR